MANSVLTQGTEVYVLAPTEADPTVYEVLYVDCPTAFDPGADSADQIETTCLNATSRSYMPGLVTPAEATLTINADPQSASHVRLYNLQKIPLKWAIGWSDGTGIAPTAKAPTGDEEWDFDLPATRTWYTFEGFIQTFPFSFETNSVVTSAISIQRSGDSLWIPKSDFSTPTPTPTPTP